MNEEMKRALLIRYTTAYETREEEERRMRECAKCGNAEGAKRHQLNREYMSGIIHGIIEAAEVFGIGFHLCENGAFELVEIEPQY